MIDISPKAGTQLGGTDFGEYRSAEIILDQLYAKALVIESDRKKICLVSLDVTIITEKYCDKIRKAVSELYGIDYDAILVFATQTHSAPGVGGFMFDPDLPVTFTKETEFLNATDTEYSEFASDMAIKAVEEAVKDMRPVQASAGRGIADKLAFNRRLITRKGEIAMPGPDPEIWTEMWNAVNNPVGPTNLLYYEGPTDPEVGVLCLRDENMQMVAMLLHFTCHPVNLFNSKSWHVVSSDWPGIWTREVQKNFGVSCIPIILNGCCGNINPWDPFEPNFVPDHKRMGKSLYSITEKIIKMMRFGDVESLDMKTQKVPLNYRDIPKERMEVVDKILTEHPLPFFKDENNMASNEDWFLAASTKSIEYCRKRMPEFMYEIKVFRIGSTAIVGLPGEPFVEGQLEIKVNSPAGFTFMAHCSSHYAGYIPTFDGCSRGGHEASPSYTYWSKLAPDSLDKISSKTVEMLNELYQKENS